MESVGVDVSVVLACLAHMLAMNRFIQAKIRHSLSNELYLDSSQMFEVVVTVFQGALNSEATGVEVERGCGGKTVNLWSFP